MTTQEIKNIKLSGTSKVIHMDKSKHTPGLIEQKTGLLKALEASNSIMFMLWELETSEFRRDAIEDQLAINRELIAKARGN